MIQETILILEEDLQLQWILKTYLENKGFTIIVSDTIEEVLEIISKVKISIFITEYWVNHGNTLETIKKIKKIKPEIYVFLNTFRVIDEEEYKNILDAGVDDFFEKPFFLSNMLVLFNKRLKMDPFYSAKTNSGENKKRVNG